LGIEKSVRFLGKVTELEKKELLTKCWLMVQPSMIEGWGITVIEANACGTPVIASNVEGLRDSISHNQTGILVRPKNTTALAEAMEKVIRDKSLRTNLSKSSISWSKRFSWSKAADQFETEFFQTLTDGKNESLIVKRPAEARASL
jgi:glycosyltransferase involved in cell wall biosynthesis